MNFSEFLIALRARRKAFAITLAAVIMTAVAVALVVPKKYVANATLLMDVRDEQQMTPGRLLRDRGYLTTQMELIRSGRVAGQVVRDLKLAAKPGVREAWEQATGGAIPISGSVATMSIPLRLTVMNFMQFFVWGSWLISLGAYMIVTLGFSGSQVGSIYATMGVGSLFMPGLIGIVADRWVNAERMYGICHLVGAGLLLWASTVKEFDTLYLSMLLNAMVYMPTIALNNTVSYKVLEQGGLNVIQTFPPIRVWGTVGFIAAISSDNFTGSDLAATGLGIGANAVAILSGGNIEWSGLRQLLD